MKFLIRIFSTGLYSGYAPIAPGTVGSGLALILFAFIPGFHGLSLFAVIPVVFFLGVFTAGEMEKTEGHDPSIVNIDEIVGMWISLIFFPGPFSWLWLVIAFLVFRFFDIIKPFPVNVSQKLSGGWGIMVDDLLAGIYTNLVIQILFFLWSRVVSHAG